MIKHIIKFLQEDSPPSMHILKRFLLFKPFEGLVVTTQKKWFLD